MAKVITIPYQGTDYTLEFTRESIEIMEKRGFKISEIIDKPVSTLPALFAGAFIAHHKMVKKSVIDSIFAGLTHKDELVEKLAVMYNEPLESLLDDPVDEGKNLSWGANW